MARRVYCNFNVRKSAKFAITHDSVGKYLSYADPSEQAQYTNIVLYTNTDARM